MMLDVLLEKIVRDTGGEGKRQRKKAPGIFSHFRFKQFFVAASRIVSRSRRRSAGVSFVRSVICVSVCVCVCVQQYPRRISVGVYVFRVALCVEYTLAANSADRSLINRSHYQATSECA